MECFVLNFYFLFFLSLPPGQISMNAHLLKEAVPTRATTPRDHLLVPVQLVWSWILEKEVAKVKLEFSISTPFLQQLFMFLSDYSFNYSLWSLSIFLFLFLASFFGRNSALSLI